MAGSWVLPTMLALPLAASVLLLVAGRGADRWARGIGVAVTGVDLALGVRLALGFDAGNAGELHARFTAPWVPQLDITLSLGVDGLSLPLVVLTALLSFLCAIYTVNHLPDPGRPRAFVGLLLFLQVGMLGTFLAQNLLLFFVFFEFVLIPMWFLIAVWGSGDRRRPAANVFILYTLTGSVLMLIGFLVLWWQAGTSDFSALAAGGGASMSSSTQLLVVLLGIATLVPIGVNGAMFGNVAHGLITGLLFFVVGGLRLRFGTTSLTELPRALYARTPRLAFLLAFAAMASLGLPGLAGFWGEFLSLVGAYLPASSELTLFRILLVVAALGTVFAAAYFLRVLRRVGQGDRPAPRVADLAGYEAASWLPLAALVLLFGLAPALLLDLTAPVVNHLLAAAVGAGR